MKRENECDRQILQNLDKALAGKEPAPGELTDNDARTAIEFARKMASLAESPRPEFQSQLKARLINRLVTEAEEARARSGSGFWQFLRKPAWVAAISTTLVIMLILGIAFASDLFRPTKPAQVASTPPTFESTAPSAAPTPPKLGATAPTATTPPRTTAAPTTTTPSAGAADTAALLAASASTDKAVYASGVPVQINASVKNVSAVPVTLQHFPPILSVMQTDSGRAVFTFAAGDAVVTLAPGDSVGFGVTWAQQDAANNPVPPGNYSVELEDVVYQGNTLKLSLSQPVRFDIQPSALDNTGAAIRTIAVNQSQTVGGITIKLLRIEQTESGFRVYAAVTPPAGTSPADLNGKYQWSGTYYVDGGWAGDAGSTAAGLSANGIDLAWYVPHVIPTGAGEMLFSIGVAGNAAGPWQFTVSVK